MLDMSAKLEEAGITAVPRPSKTTFPDGRMATKEAWNYCQAICEKLKIRAPTLRTFKWHLKHGNLIKATLVANPFGGGGPDKVYSITTEAVEAFVEEIQKNPNDLHVVEQKPRKDIVRRTTKSAPTSKDSDERELSQKEAFAYVHGKVRGRTTLNSTTFELYLIYDVIPSRLEREQRFVQVGDLDAFLELAPDGVLANHIDHPVAAKREKGVLSVKEAYEYYNSIDPTPISMNSFRSLVAAGIITVIRTASNPKAPMVGFRKQDINAFLAARQRLQENHTKKPAKHQEDKPSVSKVNVAKVMAEALEKAKPELDKAAAKAEKKAKEKAREESSKKPPVEKPKTVEEKEPRFVPTKEAYAYYQERALRPFTDSWFRDKVYRSDLFRTKVEKDVRSNNPSGKKYLVDLNSVDEYVALDPKTKPRPQKAWPVEKAYHKFEHLIPPGLSLIQFKRLVNSGLIRSFLRKSVVHVRLDAVESYFQGLEEVSNDADLQMGAAYDYYCSRCNDPVTKPHFSRWVASGDIPGGVKDDGMWTIKMSCIDDFLNEHPSGRLRTNKNSRVASESRTPRKRKDKPTKQDAPETVAKTEAPSPDSGGSISISLSDYESPVEMKKALDMLTSQGFEVVVKP